jgi:DNA-binding HxlR family transcriptional regulator
VSRAVRVEQAEICLRLAIDVIKGRWTIPILLRLYLRPTHFAELQRELGLSPKVLSTALVRMRDHGLVIRHPPERAGLKGLYRLSPAGDALRHPLDVLTRWSLEYQPQVRGADTTAPSAK